MSWPTAGNDSTFDVGVTVELGGFVYDMSYVL
jgi:hypothetical protein